MATAQEMAATVHAALRQAGFERATATSPGYVVAANKTLTGEPAEIQVNGTLRGEDAETAVCQYYAALTATPMLTGCRIRFVSDPFPAVIIRSR